MRFFVLDWQVELDRARAALAAFVRADPARLAFVPSSTVGVALALHGAALGAGDEVITTAHAYRACTNQLARLAEARGARIVTVPIDLPFDPDALVAAIARRDHAAHAARAARSRDQPDRARPAAGPADPDPARPARSRCSSTAPTPRDSSRSTSRRSGRPGTSATATSGCVRPRAPGSWWPRPTPRPGSVRWSPRTARALSYGPPNRLHAELDWSGTHDPAPHLSRPRGDRRGRRSRVAAGPRSSCATTRSPSPCAIGSAAARIAPDDAIGAMVAIPIELPTGSSPLAVERQLLREGWEVPIVDLPTGPLLRVSAHLYNHAGEADLLAPRLRALGVRLA